MNLEKEIKINKILLMLLITLSVGTIALRTSHAMFSKKETFNNVLRIITGNELPSKSAADDLIKKSGVEGEGLQGIEPETGTICTSDCKEYRYTGPSVKNYVKLNNNGQDELWRIIGVFTDEESDEKYIRIVRNELLPENYLPVSFLTNSYTTPFSIKRVGVKAYWNRRLGTDSDKNNWAKAGLQYYLNSEKDSENRKGYMSYLSTETKNMLRDTKYYLGAYNNGSTTLTSYQQERDIKKCSNNIGSTTDKYKFPVTGCNVWSGNDATWTGKISLMYPSDIGFSASKNYWSTTKLYDYNKASSTSWMFQTMSDSTEEDSWLLSPDSSDTYYVTIFETSGDIYFTFVYSYSYTYGVRPVLNIKSDVKIKKGTEGTETNPYIFEI